MYRGIRPQRDVVIETSYLVAIFKPQATQVGMAAVDHNRGVFIREVGSY